MYKEILIGIVQKLDAAFGYPVYIDDVEQKLNPPCFTVTRVEGRQGKEVGNRYKLLNSYDIKYFTETKKPAMEHIEVEEKCTNVLEWITVSGMLTKATSIRANVIDGILHIFVDYDFHVFKQTQKEEPMSDMTIKTELGGE